MTYTAFGRKGVELAEADTILELVEELARGCENAPDIGRVIFYDDKEDLTFVLDLPGLGGIENQVQQLIEENYWSSPFEQDGMTDAKEG